MYILCDYNINLLNNIILSNLLTNILTQLEIYNIIYMPTRITQTYTSFKDLGI